MWMTSKELAILGKDAGNSNPSAKSVELMARTMNFQAIVSDSKWKCHCGTNHYSVTRPTNCLTCGRIWK